MKKACLRQQKTDGKFLTELVKNSKRLKMSSIGCLLWSKTYIIIIIVILHLLFIIVVITACVTFCRRRFHTLFIVAWGWILRRRWRPNNVRVWFWVWITVATALTLLFSKKEKPFCQPNIFYTLITDMKLTSEEICYITFAPSNKQQNHWLPRRSCSFVSLITEGWLDRCGTLTFLHYLTSFLPVL